MSTSTIERLETGLCFVAEARTCIRQNRGYEKEQAREGYEAAVSEELLPWLTMAIEDMDARDVEQVARFVLKRLKRA